MGSLETKPQQRNKIANSQASLRPFDLNANALDPRLKHKKWATNKQKTNVYRRHFPGNDF